jgi:hypothetical protein
MGDEANRVASGVERPDTVPLQCIAELNGVHTGCPAIEDHDVGLDARGIDTQVRNLRDAFGKAPGILMIDKQTFGRFFQRDSARRSQHTNLAHTTAEHFAIDEPFQ